MKFRELPDLDFLHECFTVKGGRLYWKIRPASHFKTTSSHLAFNTRYAGKPAGSVTRFGYVSVRVDGVLYQAHRISVKLETGLDPEVVDHLDGNRLNNCNTNLRSCNQRKNAENSSLITYKGSVLPNGKYRLRIRYKMKSYHIGVFGDRNEAESLYWKIQEVFKEKDLTHDEIKDIISTFKPKRGK